jgi:hypothetical protein
LRLSRQAHALALVEGVGTKSKVETIRLDQALCGRGVCQTRIQGLPLYRDGGHFSIQGSRALGMQVGLGAQILDKAR